MTSPSSPFPSPARAQDDRSHRRGHSKSQPRRDRHAGPAPRLPGARRRQWRPRPGRVTGGHSPPRPDEGGRPQTPAPPPPSRRARGASQAGGRAAGTRAEARRTRRPEPSRLVGHMTCPAPPRSAQAPASRQDRRGRRATRVRRLQRHLLGPVRSTAAHGRPCARFYQALLCSRALVNSASHCCLMTVYSVQKDFKTGGLSIKISVLHLW